MNEPEMAERDRDPVKVRRYVLPSERRLELQDRPPCG